MSFRLQLLGGARLESGGEAVVGRASQRRRLAVLALLALAPRRTMTRERLSAFLWPEHAPDAARRLLTESVYVIRRELGDRVVQSVGDEIALDRAVASDVDEFLAAVADSNGPAAIKAYGGPFLDGWYVRDAPEFERWAEAERMRLAGLFSRAVRTSAESSEAAGAWADAATFWQTLVRLDPYNSSAVQQAAEAMARSGDRTAAMQTIATHEAVLRDDLGVDIAPSLAVVASRIRDGQIASFRAPASSTSAHSVPDEQPQSAPTTEPIAGPAGSTVSTEVPAAPLVRVTPSRRPPRIAFAAAAAVLLLGVSAWAAARWRNAVIPLSGAERTAASRDALDRRRIAILYFEDQSAQKELAYLADGLTEFVIGELARVPELRVMSPDAVRGLRGAPADSVARALGVRTIVQASVERSPDKVRVAARIIDANSGEQVGTIMVDALPGETFALRDRLANEMATELVRWIGQSIRIGAEQDAARVGARNDQALDLVLRAEQLRKAAGVARVNAAGSPRGVDSARAILRKADELLMLAESLDKSWALPSIERGWVAMLGGRMENGTARVVTLAPGLGHAERAITMLENAQPRDSILLARALWLRGLLRVRSGTAVQTFRAESTMIRQGNDDLMQAVAYNPRLAGAWASLAFSRWLQGDFEGVASAASRALDEDPYLEEAADVLVWTWRAEYARGNRDAAETWCAKARQRIPNDWHFVECQLTIMRLDVAGLSGRKPDPARAWAIVAELERMDPAERARTAGHRYSPIYRRMLAAMVSAAAGDGARARAVLVGAQREVKADAELETDLLYETACLHFVLGDRAAGERALTEYLKARPDMMPFISRDRVVRRLRGRS